MTHPSVFLCLWVSEYRKGLAGTRDAVGQDGAVKSLEHPGHFRLQGVAEDGEVAGLLPEHTREDVVTHTAIRILVLLIAY